MLFGDLSRMPRKQICVGGLAFGVFDGIWISWRKNTGKLKEAETSRRWKISFPGSLIGNDEKLEER